MVDASHPLPGLKLQHYHNTYLAIDPLLAMAAGVVVCTKLQLQTKQKTKTKHPKLYKDFAPCPHFARKSDQIGLSEHGPGPMRFDVAAMQPHPVPLECLTPHR